MNCLLKKTSPARRTMAFPVNVIYRYLVPAAVIAVLSFCGAGIAVSEERSAAPRTEVPGGMRMTVAVICEEIRDGQPVNEGIIFSSDLGKITCFTEFDSITKKTTVYHCWYFKDNLRAKRKPLVLNPPRWSTFSQIEPRETDKGPWRVEIVDENGNILKTLRFSIID